MHVLQRVISPESPSNLQMSLECAPHLQVRPPMPPRYVFVIDVSYVAVTSGALPVICQAIKDSLDRLPGGERTQVGFLTFDSTMHFYNLAPRLSQPQMMVGCCPAVQEPPWLCCMSRGFVHVPQFISMAQCPIRLALM